jgi:tetratricopeptide (TPR) repeat protein
MKSIASRVAILSFWLASFAGAALADSAGGPSQPATSALSRPHDMTCRVPEPGAQELAKEPRVQKYSEQLAADPGNPDALWNRGLVYLAIGADRLALADLNALIGRGGAIAEDYNNRCYARIRLDDVSGAIEDCDRALAMKPDFADAYDTRGLARLKSGQPQAAIEDFDAALKLNPRLGTSLYARGIAKQQIGAAADAESDMDDGMLYNGNAGNEVASYGIDDPHSERGLNGVVHISEKGVITVANGYRGPDGSIADTMTAYEPGEPGYEEVVRHLCGLQPGDQKLFRTWRRR